MTVHNLKCSRGVVEGTEKFYSFLRKSMGSIVQTKGKLTIVTLNNNKLLQLFPLQWAKN